MFVTAQEMFNARVSAEGGLSVDAILRDLIPEDEQSPEKAMMRAGERYYAGEHDILQHNFQRSFVYGEGGRREELINENNSNYRQVHNFHAHHVDQKVAYCFGRPFTVTVEGAAEDAGLKAYEQSLSRITTDEEFRDMVIDAAIGASNEGVDWIHPYYDAAGRLRFAVVPGHEVRAFYDAENQNTLTDIIRYWTIQVVRGDKTLARHRVEWWTSQSVTYLEEDDEGHYQPMAVDRELPCNPAPHWWSFTTLNGQPVTQEKHSWGRVPFIAFRNNRGSASDLVMYKGLIDAYNILASKATNDQVDMAYLYWVIQGYGGEAAKAILKKLNYNKSVFIDTQGGDTGSVDAKTVTLGTADRIEWLKFLRSDIYHQGRAFDESPETVGNATNVALQLQYANLDMKADPFISKFKVGFKELFWFITEDINRREGTAYDASLVRVDIQKNRIINETELIDNITASVGFVPNSLLLTRHPFVDDPEQAAADLAAEKRVKARDYLNGDTFE